MLTPIKIGRYEVVSTLGQGAMGRVFKAVDPLIERTVAIKTIHLELAQDERAEFEERFYREAKSAGRLSHANIVTIYDVGEVDDMAYIAMEYLEGESLREKLDSGVVLPLGAILRIVARVAQALHYAHENQVVHRDIKPANILITAQRDVKILDFGIAQIPTGSRTQHGTVLGSPNYMAPEQVRSEPVDGRTDIFALGVVLYEMLTGVSPFKGDTLSATMFKILNMEPAPPSSIHPSVPPELDRIVAQALAKRPDARFATAGEFARALRMAGEALAAGSGDDTAEIAPGAANLARGPRRAADPADATVLLAPPRSAASRPRLELAPILAWSRSPRGRKTLAFGLPMVLLVAVVLSNAWQGAVRTGAGEDDARAPQIVAQGHPETVAPLLPVVPLPAAQSRAPDGAEPDRKEAAVPTPPSLPTPSVAPPARPGILTLAISPWGEVFIDGKRAGVSPPLNRIEVEPGRHRVEVRNQAFAPYRDTVTVEPGESFKIRHKFK